MELFERKFLAIEIYEGGNGGWKTRFNRGLKVLKLKYEPLDLRHVTKG